MEKNYIASFQNNKGECWDTTIKSNNYKEAMKEARRMQKEFGKLWSLRMEKSWQTEAREAMNERISRMRRGK